MDDKNLEVGVIGENLSYLLNRTMLRDALFQAAEDILSRGADLEFAHNYDATQAMLLSIKQNEYAPDFLLVEEEPFAHVSGVDIIQEANRSDIPTILFTGDHRNERRSIWNYIMRKGMNYTHEFSRILKSHFRVTV